MDEKTLLDITKKINQMYQDSLRKPAKIKINEKWLEDQIEQQNIILRHYEKSNVDGYGVFRGIPMKTDNAIQSFEIVYKGGK